MGHFNVNTRKLKKSWLKTSGLFIYSKQKSLVFHNIKYRGLRVERDST